MSSPTSLSAARADAIVRRDRGDLNGARALLERALEAATLTSGDDHPEVLTTAHLLASLHRLSGDLSGARRVLEYALYAGSNRHGDDHPLLLSISSDMAEIADELGNRHEARRHYTRVARLGPTAQGFDQQQVQVARAWLGPSAPVSAGDGEPVAPLAVKPHGVPIPTRPPISTPVPQPLEDRYPVTMLAGGFSADRVDPDKGISLADDQLSLGAYVSMLATLVAHRETPMPISIGLFGKWGSGKSFLMGLLREEINRLSKSDSDDYLPDIVQIGFNAWHYSDSNLWASLGDEIFRQLAGPGEDAESRRTRLNADLAEVSEHRKRFQSQNEHAKVQTARLKERLDEVSASQNATALDLLEALSRSETVRSQLGKLWGRLGVTDRTEQARLFSQEVRGTITEVSAMRGLLRSRLGGIATLAAVVAMGFFAAAALMPPDWQTWLGTAWKTWAGTAGTVTLSGALATALLALQKFQSGLAQLRQMASEVRAGTEARAQRRNAVEIEALLGDLRTSEAEQELVQAQLEDLVARAGELGRQLSDLKPGQRLYSFVADRASSDLYSQHLGLVSTIRKDFQNLADLMEAWRRRQADDEGRRPIDRVVLYIDDLDRCRPKQVVEVLQAVHLLLALDPFVVVVGVDPRWLIQSLRQQYDGVLSAEEAGDWSVASPGYLEKIFNIPFIVPDMPPGSLRHLIHTMAGPIEGERAGASPTETVPPSQFTPEGSTDAYDVLPVAPIVASIPLTEREIRLLGDLENLVATPRDAKRLFNLYRMLRSTPDLATATTFLDGEYEAVVILLGFLTADATLLSKMLYAKPKGLIHRPPTEEWAAFVAALEPVDGYSGPRNGIVDRIPRDEFARWIRLHAGAAKLLPHTTLKELSAFQRWAPVVRRFSFILSTASNERDSDAYDPQGNESAQTQ